jgi:hypothetical protein
VQRWEFDAGVTWTIEDFDEIVRSGSPFCRKVDPAVSGELMDALDRWTQDAQQP